MEGNVDSSPAVSDDDDTIFVGSHDNKVYALDALTDAKKWSFKTGGRVSLSPAISNDSNDISWDKKAYALDALYGSQKWSFETGDVVHSTTAISHDGATVFVGSNDKKVYALNTGIILTTTVPTTTTTTTPTLTTTTPSLRPRVLPHLDHNYDYDYSHTFVSLSIYYL